MSNSKVLVVMPCFNHEDFVIEAINSLHNQTYKNYDLICCDDKSTDSTLEILKREQDKFGYQILKNEENLGTGKTVNKCIDYALQNYDYEYITWISSDNILKPNFLELHVGLLDQDYAITYSGWSYKDQPVKHMPNENLIHLKYNYMLGPSFMFRKKLFLKAGPFEEGAGEDYYFSVNCALVFAKFGYIKEYLVDYRYHSNSVTGRDPHPTRNACSGEAIQKSKLIFFENGFMNYK